MWLMATNILMKFGEDLMKTSQATEQTTSVTDRQTGANQNVSHTTMWWETQ